MNPRSLNRVVAIVSGAVALCACEAPARVPPQVPQTTSSSAPFPSSSSSTRAAPAEGALSDAQIAEIADEANAGEVEVGRYAVQQATDPRVKQFAQHMVAAHGAMGQKMAAVLHTEMITPAPSAESAQLTASSRQTLESLESKSGSEFDKAYIDGQVMAHEAAFDLFDNRLIPFARDPELKARLQEERLMVVEHLKEAIDVQRRLALS